MSVLPPCYLDWQWDWDGLYVFGVVQKHYLSTQRENITFELAPGEPIAIGLWTFDRFLLKQNCICGDECKLDTLLLAPSDIHWRVDTVKLNGAEVSDENVGTFRASGQVGSWGADSLRARADGRESTGSAVLYVPPALALYDKISITLKITVQKLDISIPIGHPPQVFMLGFDIYRTNEPSPKPGSYLPHAYQYTNFTFEGPGSDNAKAAQVKDAPFEQPSIDDHPCDCYPQQSWDPEAPIELPVESPPGIGHKGGQWNTPDGLIFSGTTYLYAVRPFDSHTLDLSCTSDECRRPLPEAFLIDTTAFLKYRWSLGLPDDDPTDMSYWEWERGTDPALAQENLRILPDIRDAFERSLLWVGEAREVLSGLPQLEPPSEPPSVLNSIGFPRIAWKPTPFNFLRDGSPSSPDGKMPSSLTETLDAESALDASRNSREATGRLLPQKAWGGVVVLVSGAGKPNVVGAAKLGLDRAGTLLDEVLRRGARGFTTGNPLVMHEYSVDEKDTTLLDLLKFARATATALLAANPITGAYAIYDWQRTAKEAFGEGRKDRPAKYYDRLTGVRIARKVLEYCLTEYRSGRPVGPVILIGHGVGASACVQATNILNEMGIGVDELVAIDRRPMPLSAFGSLVTDLAGAAVEAIIGKIGKDAGGAVVSALERRSASLVSGIKAQFDSQVERFALGEMSTSLYKKGGALLRDLAADLKGADLAKRLGELGAEGVEVGVEFGMDKLTEASTEAVKQAGAQMIDVFPTVMYPDMIRRVTSVYDAQRVDGFSPWVQTRTADLNHQVLRVAPGKPAPEVMTEPLHGLAQDQDLSESWEFRNVILAIADRWTAGFAESRIYSAPINASNGAFASSASRTMMANLLMSKISELGENGESAGLSLEEARNLALALEGWAVPPSSPPGTLEGTARVPYVMR